MRLSVTNVVIGVVGCACIVGLVLMVWLKEGSGLLPRSVESETPSGTTVVTRCAVEYVVDGDTLHCQDGPKVRLLGVDAPELGRDGESDQCWARESREALRELVDGKSITVSPDAGQDEIDTYGRTLAYARNAGGELVNLAMVRSGDARARTSRPPLAEVDALTSAERAARSAGHGLWKGCRG